jgi:hypothetical protein
VNELQLIRNQLDAERNRAAELAAAVASAGAGVATGAGTADTDTGAGTAGAGTGAMAIMGASKTVAGAALRQACVDYLVFVLTRFEERDQMLADLVRARFAESDATRKALLDALGRPGTSREALAKLEAALGSTSPPPRREPPNVASAADFAAYFEGPWRIRRDAIDSLQEAHLRVTDWRAVSFVDADSIMEERARYARVQSARGATAA